VLPFIDGEEPKIEREMQKMLGRLVDGAVEPASFVVSAHANRVPVEHGHTVCLSVECDRRPAVDEALAALRANPAAFDLVLTDYNMPGMSGLDVAREVKAIRADLPVAVASGFIDVELHALAAEAGVQELIFKADAVDVLCDAVQRVIQGIGAKRS
jgi:aspartate-semialdehyde dehydrogenase